MMPILEINEFPVRELKICIGCWEWGGHKDTWCNNVDPYAECSYIDTPQSHIAESYILLRSSKVLLFEMITMDDIKGIQKIKKIISELKEIIKFYEIHL
jgi:hypothetical protein